MKNSLKENYIRLFGNLTEHDLLGRKKGILKEGNYFNDDVEFGVKVSLRHAQQATNAYRDSLKSTGITEQATDQYICPDEDSLFELLITFKDWDIPMDEIERVVYNGKEMPGEQFMKRYGREIQ